MKSYIISFGDAGVGGLIFALDSYAAMRNSLENLESIYNVKFEIHHFGDTKNAPYGQKTPEEIAILTKKYMSYLVAKSDITILACNSSESEDFVDNQKIITIIDKSAEALYNAGKIITTKNGAKQLHLGLLATPVTIANGKYQKKLATIHGNQPDLEMFVHSFAPKKWVYNIENGIDEHVVEDDLQLMMEQNGAENISALGLFCTHYPFYKKRIARFFEKKEIRLISQGEIFADIIMKKIDSRDFSFRTDSFVATPPVIISEISGDNLKEVASVAQAISPNLFQYIKFTPSTVKHNSVIQ